jgi:hypothetical protein
VEIARDPLALLLLSLEDHLARAPALALEALDPRFSSSL